MKKMMFVLLALMLCLLCMTAVPVMADTGGNDGAVASAAVAANAPVQDYIQEFIALVDGIKITILVAMIAANFLLAVAVSLYTKKFRLKSLGDFLLTRVLPYVISYGAVGMIAVVEPSWKVAVTIVWGIIIASLVGAILSNLKEMGINLPDSIAGDSS